MVAVRFTPVEDQAPVLAGLRQQLAGLPARSEFYRRLFDEYGVTADALTSPMT